MLTSNELIPVFVAKLQATQDFDAAFRKVVWVAYIEGVLAGSNDHNIQTQCRTILAKAYNE